MRSHEEKLKGLPKGDQARTSDADTTRPDLRGIRFQPSWSHELSSNGIWSLCLNAMEEAGGDHHEA